MKKLPAFFIIILFFFISSFSYAQEFNFKKAYEDYLFNFNKYRKSHSEYITAKEAYSSYKTLTSKNTAKEKTSKLILNEDEVIRTYLTALRLKLAETTGVSSYEQNVIYLKLDKEISLYLKHQDRVSIAGDLEDLVKLAQENKENYKTTETLSYQTLGSIFASKEINLRNKLNNQITLLKEKIGEIRQKGDKQTTKIERWLLEAENRLLKSQEKEFEAQQKLAQLKSTNRYKNKDYNEAQYLFEQSHQYLKEASKQLQEIIRETKTAD